MGASSVPKQTRNCSDLLGIYICNIDRDIGLYTIYAWSGYVYIYIYIYIYTSISIPIYMYIYVYTDRTLEIGRSYICM